MRVLSEIRLEQLKQNDVEITYMSEKELHTYEGQDIDVIVCCRSSAAKVANMNFPSLKLVQLTSAGYDNVPLEVFKQKGIWVCNAGNVYSIPIAEMIVYGMLQMAKKYHKNPKRHGIRIARNYRYMTELSGKTVTILGTGGIGSAVAARLQGFGMQIYGYSKEGETKVPFIEDTNQFSRLQEMLSESSYVISTLPDMPALRGFFNRELFALMPKDCVFLNVGRRATIEEDDLFAALKSRQIGGAVLDMFEVLPNPITNRFRRLSNVIVWPGVSAISQEVKVRLQELAIQNIESVKKQEKPKCIIGGE